jgi:hypothetical protein
MCDASSSASRAFLVAYPHGGLGDYRPQPALTVDLDGDSRPDVVSLRAGGSANDGNNVLSTTFNRVLSGCF